MFAITRSSLKGKSRKRDYDIVDSDFEETPKPKKERRTLLVIETKLDNVKDDVESIKEMVEDVCHLNERCKLPLGLYRIVRESFQCRICLSVPMKPPIVISRCCKVIIGCERCVNGWYSGAEALTKTCPSCRTERGYSETMVLKGIDSFLVEVKKVIQTPDERDDEQLPHIIV